MSAFDKATGGSSADQYRLADGVEEIIWQFRVLDVALSELRYAGQLMSQEDVALYGHP